MVYGYDGLRWLASVYHISGKFSDSGPGGKLWTSVINYGKPCKPSRISEKVWHEWYMVNVVKLKLSADAEQESGSSNIKFKWPLYNIVIVFVESFSCCKNEWLCWVSLSHLSYLFVWYFNFNFLYK